MGRETLESVQTEYAQLRDLAERLFWDAWEVTFGDDELGDKNDRIGGITEESELETNYTSWFTRALLVVQQIVPQRSQEFERLYYSPNSRIVVDDQTMTIQDWILGRKPEAMTWDSFNRQMLMLVHLQKQIFDSVGEVLTSAIANIRGLLCASLFADELQESRELLTKGFVRAAGVVAGVVLEHKLTSTCTENGLTLKKKPPLGDLVAALEAADAVSVDEGSLLRRLTNLRNQFTHVRPQEPDESNAEELIRGVERVLGSTFLAAPPASS